MRSIILFVLVLISATAHAYVGPGLGLGVLGAILGGIVAVFLALVGVVWYPLKRMLKKRKASRSSTTADNAEDQTHRKKDSQDLEQSSDA